MPIEAVMLYPLQVLVADDTSRQICRVPVMPGGNATASFGAPQPGVTAARGAGGVVARDIQRIADAVGRGAMPQFRAAYWAACAAAGHNIDVVDQLEGGGILMAAGAASEPDEYTRLFAAPGARQTDDDGTEYSALFCDSKEGQRRADEVKAGARRQVAAITDDELHPTLFGQPSRRPPATPVTASAAAGAGKPGRQKQYRVHAARLSLRVPDQAASAGSDGWRLIELRAGDRVPADAHPADIDQLLRRRSSATHGADIKEW
jgi:hypothetical protein